MSRGATLLSSVFALFVVLFVGASEARAVCCGASCCSIDGACRATGAVNPANSCEECRPTGSGGQFDWTPISGCTSGGTDSGRPDAGTTTPPRSSGGCSVGGHAEGSAPLAMLALALGLGLARRCV